MSTPTPPQKKQGMCYCISFLRNLKIIANFVGPVVRQFWPVCPKWGMPQTIAVWSENNYYNDNPVGLRVPYSQTNPHEYLRVPPHSIFANCRDVSLVALAALRGTAVSDSLAQLPWQNWLPPERLLQLLPRPRKLWRFQFPPGSLNPLDTKVTRSFAQSFQSLEKKIYIVYESRLGLIMAHHPFFSNTYSNTIVDLPKNRCTKKKTETTSQAPCCIPPGLVHWSLGHRRILDSSFGWLRDNATRIKWNKNL